MNELPYRKYMKKAEFEKALNALNGIILGVIADDVMNEMEISELKHWCFLYDIYSNRHPFKEIIHLILTSIDDKVLTSEEKADILWVFDSYKNRNQYFDMVTSDIQVLQGILHGVLGDNSINKKELIELKKWLDDNSCLENTYPYDEIYSVIFNILKDGKIDLEEEKLMKVLFSDFIDTKNSYNINLPEIEIMKKEMNIQGICALAPNIEFNNKIFCFTGESNKINRDQILNLITIKGGIAKNTLVNATNYLIVGNNGNPCWAFSCYGRKIEKAMALRKQGRPIIIVNEIDFWDAVNE
jgi:NAD-dependent DNA ligase